MRYAILITAAVTLAGCGKLDRTEYPIEVCHERDTVSGRCLQAEYICTKPLTLRPAYGGAVCMFTTPHGVEPR